MLEPLVPMVAFSRPPDGHDWHHRELLAAIAAAAGPGEPRVAVVANDNFFSVSNFRYEVVRDRLPLRLSRAWDQAPMGVDFAIVKTGDQGPRPRPSPTGSWLRSGAATPGWPRHIR
jgi:hypothetical protein